MEGKITLMPALCLDWESTIVRSKSGARFITGADDIELRPGVERTLGWYRDMGYLILAISNQNAPDSGLKLPPEVIRERDVTIALFGENNPMNMFLFSFCGGEGAMEPYCHRSLCRMPYIGGLAVAEVQAYQQLGVFIDWDKSLMVGDRPEHEQCAHNAGMAFRTAHSFANEPHIF